MSYVRTPEMRAAASAKLKGRKLSPEHRAAISAAQIGHKRGVGLKASAEARRKMSLAKLGNQNLLGHRHSAETRARMSAAHMGQQTGLGWRATEEQKRTRSERMRIYMKTPERWAKQAVVLRSVCHLGGPAALDSLKRKRIEYLDRRGRLWNFRSSYELRYARMLDAEALTWSYEPDRLLLSDGRTYVPDFWVSEWTAYVEVKGWAAWRMDKVDLARRDGHLIFLVGRSIVGRSK